jgi:hypothetical protein
MILAGLLRPGSEVPLHIIQTEGTVGHSTTARALRPDFDWYIQCAEAVVVHIAHT